MPTIGNTPRPGYVYDSETDTWIPIGVGPHTHDYVDKTLIDAKGDLLVGTGDNTVGILSVSAEQGATIVADSAAATGLSYKEDYAAGKNAIINGDFFINQRNVSSTTTTGDFPFDRWKNSNTGGTSTYSSETFTLGSAPVAGYEGKTFLRIVSTGQSAAGDRTTIQQFIESVRTFAGQTVTVSFWAKASTGTPNIAVELAQSFGVGGSPSASVLGIGSTKLGITSSWVRYSVTISVPSIAGKTLGTTDDGSLNLVLWTSAGSTWDSRTGTLGIQSVTIDFWGVQIEAGSVATAFQTATGTLQGELAACQRYFYVIQDTQYLSLGFGNYPEATKFRIPVQYPVTMRTAPTLSAPSGSGLYSIIKGAGNDDFNDLAISSASKLNALIGTDANVSGTAGQAFYVLTNTTTGTVISMSAEL
jgi:hypothetical protein